MFDSVLGYFLSFWNKDSSKRQSSREEIKRVMRRNKKGFMLTFPTHHVLPAQLPAANNSPSIPTPPWAAHPRTPLLWLLTELCSAFPAPETCSRSGIPPPWLPSEASPASNTFIGETCHAHTRRAPADQTDAVCHRA